VRRTLLTSVALIAILVPGVAGAAAGSGVRITAVDTSAYPSVRVTVVTPQPAAKAPRLNEDGQPVVGFTAKNFGREKSVVLLFDRSQSMLGRAMQDATAAARSFVRSKPASDRIAVVAVGKQAFQLTGFSSGTSEADSALRGLEVDKVRGTALYDAVVLSSELLAADVHQSRVLVLVTDGQEVSSKSSLDEAIAAANDARVTVYPIGIESASFKPGPLKRLAAETGGRYSGAAGTASLQKVYAALAQELRRTWQLTYFTTARPGDKFELAAGGSRITALAPGIAAEAATESSVPDPVFAVGPTLVATVVGACILIAAIFLLKAPVGAGLRRRLAPHIGEPQRKRARGPAEERFATASSLMRATERAFGNLSLWHKLHRLLERADLPLRTVELVYICAGSAFLLALIVGLAGAGSIFSLIALVLGALLPVGFVGYKARQRLNAIDEQLPDLLITLAASLKAGHSFRAGIQAVVDEGQPPASKEFNRVLTETRLGRPMDDALADMAERVGSNNLSFVVTAVTIQRQVGGSLAGIFDMVADAVRNRQQFARKIKGLTAMGRMSAYVLVGIPFFMAGSISLLSRDYMSPLFFTGTGQKMLVLGLVMIGIGSLMLRKIVNFKG
jgi:tight adherence protein B